jgi:methylamine--corrinoid protein Co-methyltransferase
MIGGYSGPPEGTAIANIASDLLQFAMLGTDISNCSIFDVRQNSVCGRQGLWTMSMSVQATSRNTHTILDKIINQTAGPCTEDILYTNMAGLVTTCVSGMELTTGPRSAGGSMRNFLTPLEGFVCADIFKAAADLSLSEANELALYGLSKYEATVENQPIGKSFEDCYNIETLQPSAEWQGIADKVRGDLSKRGLAL